jgi:hypothetical protein
MTRLPDGQAGPVRLEAGTAASTQALASDGFASRRDCQPFVPLSRLFREGRTRLWRGADVHRRWLVAVFLLALILRIAWVAATNPDPLDGRFDDAVFPEQ